MKSTVLLITIYKFTSRKKDGQVCVALLYSRFKWVTVIYDVKFEFNDIIPLYLKLSLYL